jgi:hypothetical protein
MIVSMGLFRIFIDWFVYGGLGIRLLSLLQFIIYKENV